MIEALILNPPSKRRRMSKNAKRVVRAHRRKLGSPRRRKTPRPRRARRLARSRRTFVYRPTFRSNASRSAYQREATTRSLFSPLFAGSEGGTFYRPGEGGSPMAVANVKRRRSRRRSHRSRRSRRNVAANPRRTVRRVRRTRRGRRVRRNDWPDNRPGHRTASRRAWRRRKAHRRGYKKPRGRRMMFGHYGYPVWKNPLGGILGGVKDVFRVQTLMDGAAIAGGALFSIWATNKIANNVIKKPEWATGYKGALVALLVSGVTGALIGGVLRKPSIGRNVMLGGVATAATGLIAKQFRLATTLGDMGNPLLNALVADEVARELGVGDYLDPARMLAAPELGDYAGPVAIGAAPALGEFDESADWADNTNLDGF